LTDALESTKRVYAILGLQYKPGSRLGVNVVFHEPKSTNPGRDVEQALVLRCRTVFVKLMERENFEEQDRSFVEEQLSLGKNASGGPPLLEGDETSCDITGMAPGGKTPTGRLIYRTLFDKHVSTTPSKDVERAINAGSTQVSLEVTKWGTGPRPS